MMDRILFVFSVFLLVFQSFNCTSQNTGLRSVKPINQLSQKEINEGWILLFDGQTTNGWRSFNFNSVNDGWQVLDGNLVALGNGSDLGGDIITTDRYEDFELYLEWAISGGGNSGIFFHVLEEGYSTVYASGPEYQIIDDIGFPEPLEDWQTTGANYAMHPPSKKISKPVGEFNSSKIKVMDGVVEHWLNEEKVVEYELWSDEWKNLVQQGKWKNYSGYGLARNGHIALQDHGSIVKFRNIRIRDLTDKGKALFDGKSLDGWNTHGTEIWRVENGELICESGPDQQYGYLLTDKSFTDFILKLEFKQETNGNSGVFFRSSIEDAKISGWQVEVAPKGMDTGGIYESYGRGWLIQIPDEKEQILKEGDWNKLVIRVIGDRVITWLNDEMMADLKDEKIGKATGAIALQIHEGGGIKVRWRNIFIREL